MINISNKDFANVNPLKEENVKKCDSISINIHDYIAPPINSNLKKDIEPKKKSVESVIYKGKEHILSSKDKIGEGDFGIVYKSPDPNFVIKVFKHNNKSREIQLANSMNQRAELVKANISVAKIDNLETAARDNFLAIEFFPNVLNDVFDNFYSQNNEHLPDELIKLFAQFLKKVIVCGVKNVDVKPDNLGIREKDGKKELVLFDFDEQASVHDFSESRMMQAIDMVVRNNKSIAQIIIKELTDLDHPMAKNLCLYCSKIESITLTLPTRFSVIDLY